MVCIEMQAAACCALVMCQWPCTVCCGRMQTGGEKDVIDLAEPLKIVMLHAGTPSSAGSTKVGAIAGSWLSEVTVTCPSEHTEGTIYDCKSCKEALVTCLNIKDLGPMKWPRLWSAIHDAVWYADVKMASGGRAAVKMVSSPNVCNSECKLKHA